HQAQALVAVSSAEDHSLEEQAGNRAARPGAELLLQIAAKDDFLAEASGRAEEEIGDDVGSGVRQQTLCACATAGVQQACAGGKDHAGNNQEDNGDAYVAQDAGPVGPSSSDQITKSEATAADAEPDERHDQPVHEDHAQVAEVLATTKSQRRQGVGVRAGRRRKANEEQKGDGVPCG